MTSMTSTSIPRFLLPRGIAFPQGLFARTLYPQPRALPACRNASTTPQKPIVLEKPEKFNPPSHPQRLNKRPSPRSYPGPRLSESQVQEQKTKQYPNTLPPKGTWRYRFLTNRRIHVFITLVRSVFFICGSFKSQLPSITPLWQIPRAPPFAWVD